MSVSVTNTTLRGIPTVPFSNIARTILGKRYVLSIVFLTPSEIKTLNRSYRRKNATTDVLSFSLTKTSGELCFSMSDVVKKAAEFGMSTRSYLAFLAVHSMLHLKGFDHGTRMESLEKKYCKKLGIAHIYTA